MTLPDLSFVHDARQLEVEAIEGGRPLNEFTLDPQLSENDEEIPLFGRSVDDAEETEERARSLRSFTEHARAAYRQRGLSYPFQISSSRDSLEILPGHRRLAVESAKLSSMIGIGKSTAKEFEEKAFRALHTLVGGTGFCVGAPRRNRKGPKHAIKQLRELLHPWEYASRWADKLPRSGDQGADGFLFLGRSWGGPIIFYQAKNTNFSLTDFPEEVARMSQIHFDWLGKRYNQIRHIIPVLALNTVLTIDMKEQIFQERGGFGMHIFDAVDILCAEFTDPTHAIRESRCVVF
jgi:hypothetical protein